jgi:protein-disulfide isomerase
MTNSDTHPNQGNDYVKQASLQTSSLLITLLVAALSFTCGYLYSQVKGGGKALGATTGTTAAAPTGTAGAAAAQPTDAPISMDKVKALFTKDHITFGDPSKAKIIFVEWIDRSCPYCHVANGNNPELAKSANFAYKDDGGTYDPPVPHMEEMVKNGQAAMVQLYTLGHGNGLVFEQAARCAYQKDEDTFWAVTHKLMSNEGYTLANDTVKNDFSQSQKVADFLADVADPTYMNDCISKNADKDEIEKENSLAASYNVQGTPQFFVNTTVFKGAYGWPDMQSAVDAAQK